MGKTSTPSRFNVPGKIGWATMEAPGFITLLYIMYSLPKQEGIESLPFVNWVMAGLFVSSVSRKRLVMRDRRAKLLILKDDPLRLPCPSRTTTP